MRYLLDKYFPEKTVFISNLDKQWMTPELKQLLRQAQRERVKSGNGSKFKKLWRKFRRIKRKRIKSYNEKIVEGLQTEAPEKWHKYMKRLGGLEQVNSSRLEIESLKGLSDQECAEAVAQSFAETVVC